MASVWLSIFMLVLITITQVIARNCSDTDRIMNCNECIRCGAIWCNDPKELTRCSLSSIDDWCPDHQESLEDQEAKPTPEVIKLGVNVDSYVRIRDKIRLHFEFPSETNIVPKVKSSILHSTVQKLDPAYFRLPYEALKYHEDTKKFTFTLVGTPTVDFCPEAGTKEYVTVKVEVEGRQESSTVKFAVPCSCGCSAKVEKKSEHCHKRGDYACGACACEKGWEGEDCLIKQSPNNISHCPDRGDITFCLNLVTNFLCSDNGKCCDGKCECFNQLEGSEYFDDTCDDICSTTSYHDTCLIDPTIGECKDHANIYIEPLNTTLLNVKSPDTGRNIWYNCTERTESCNIRYAAMKDGNGQTRVMIVDSCQPVADPYASGAIKVTVPVTLGVIAIVLAMAAAAGYMVYKNRTPPLPLTDPQYQNIDAEDCTGENPLYKPPTSSFKNPTYGKW